MHWRVFKVTELFRLLIVHLHDLIFCVESRNQETTLITGILRSDNDIDLELKRALATHAEPLDSPFDLTDKLKRPRRGMFGIKTRAKM